MARYLIFFLPVFILHFRCLTAQVMVQISPDTSKKWFYYDGDEFNSARINTAQWAYAFGWSRSIASNQEQQYYSDGNNHTLKDGILSLFARRELVQKRLRDSSPDNDSIFFSGKFDGMNLRDFSFTSGMLRSRKTYQYGYFEIKFRMPARKGFWPAFWLFGGFPNEEIDIMELKTEKRNRIHVARYSTKREENYLRKGFVKRQWGGWIKMKGDLTEGFYVMAGEWTPDDIKWFLNGELIALTKVNLPNRKELAVNLAVPGNDGPFKPGPDDTTSISGDFEIDYIRIWTEEKKSDRFSMGNFEGTEQPVSASELITKKSFLYGKKKDRQKEGLTITLVGTKGGEVRITVLGKEVRADATIKILDNTGNAVYIQPLVYGHSVLNKNFAAGNFWRIELNAYGRTIQCMASDLLIEAD